jgi:polysaccharide export outer membrane protein
MAIQRSGQRRARRVSLRYFFGICLSICLSVSAAAFAMACSHASPPPPEAGPMDRADYVIGSADVLRIQVWRNPELSVDVPVRPDGKISVPLANDVQAAGLTATELKDVITQALTEFVAAPDVTVMVREIRSKSVHVVGEVARPTVLQLVVDMRALEVIAAAGGFTPYADKSDIRILRPNPDGTVVEYRFNYNAFLRGKQPEGNLRLQPGDTVVVPD